MIFVIDYLLAFSILSSQIIPTSKEKGRHTVVSLKLCKQIKTHLEKNGSHGSIVFEWFVQRLFYRSKHPTVLVSIVIKSYLTLGIHMHFGVNSKLSLKEEKKHSLRSNSIEKLCCIPHCSCLTSRA